MAISWRALAAAALASGGAAAVAQPFADDFDGYAAGSAIAGQGGWSVWYSGGVDATVSTEQAASGANSMRLAAMSDMVQTFSANAGRWRFSANVYIPSTATGGTREIAIFHIAFRGSLAEEDIGFWVGAQRLPDFIHFLRRVGQEGQLGKAAQEHRVAVGKRFGGAQRRDGKVAHRTRIGRLAARFRVEQRVSKSDEGTAFRRGAPLAAQGDQRSS